MSNFFNTILINILIFILSLFVLSYIYMKYLYTYWSRKKVPFIEPSFPFGNTKDIILKKQCIGLGVKDIYNELKKRKLPFGGFYSLGKPLLMINDPDLIKLVLTKEFKHFCDRDHFTDEKNDPLTLNVFGEKGNKWKNLRAKLTPTFTSGKMKQMFDIFLLCSESLANVVDKEAKTGRSIDIKDILERFTSDIIGSCAFGIECNSLADPQNEFRKYSIEALKSSYRQFLVRTLNDTSNFLTTLLNIRVFNTDVANFFSKFVKDIVEYREKNNIQRNDIMNMLIEFKNNKTINYNEIQDVNKNNTDGMTMDQITANVVLFFLAGYDTSSNTMAFALFELAINQDIQKKLREEISTCLKKHDNDMNYYALEEMRFLDKIIKETLRKYPVGPTFNRLCVKDLKMPNSDVVVEKGTTVVLSVMGLHHDPDYYPDPMKFDPERFNEEQEASRHQYTYLPFGEGPRHCIGKRFGLLQTKLGIACLIRKFKFTLDLKTKIPSEYNCDCIVLSFQDAFLLQATKV